jgi:hypothetical protein
MMGIGINSVSSTSSDYSSLKSALSAIAKGQQPATAGAGANSSDDSEETRIVTRTQSDGSEIIMVMQGNKIISERKVGGDKDSENKSALSVNTQIAADQGSANAADAKIGQYEAGNAIAAGLVFNANA